MTTAQLTPQYRPGERVAVEPGIIRRVRSDGTLGKYQYMDARTRTYRGAESLEDARQQKAQSLLAKGKGLPKPDTRVRIRDLAEEVRASKRGRLRTSSFAAFEHGLDRVILPRFGDRKPAQVGPDSIAQLVRDLEGKGLKPATIKRYLVPLSDIFQLAIRRGAISTNPLDLLTNDERPQAVARKPIYVWSPTAIRSLLAAAEVLGRRAISRFDYSPLIRVLVFTGLRVSEALALRWKDIDLLGGVLHVRHSLNRDGTLGEPKTDAGRRDVPLSDALVGLLLNLKPEDAADDHFVFATKDDPTRPLSYRNFERRGFRPAVTAAGLDGNGLTIHSLRHAAASWLIASGMSAVDVASVLGHADSSITLRVYASLFDGQAVADRVRAAQQALLDPVEREAA